MIAGYLTGRIVIEHGRVTLQRSDGSPLLLTEVDTIEVRNGEYYELLALEQALSRFTAEGWPAYAGLYARVKRETTTQPMPKH